MAARRAGVRVTVTTFAVSPSHRPIELQSAAESMMPSPRQKPAACAVSSPGVRITTA